MDLHSLISLYNNKSKHGLIIQIRKNKIILDELISLTSFMNNDTSISARLYCITNNIKNKPICICGKQLKFHKLNKGFFKTCGDNKCLSIIRSNASIEANKNKDWNYITKKIKQTNIERYGVESNFSKNSNTRKEYEKIMIEKYGHKYALQNKHILQKQQNTLLEREGTLDMFHISKTINTNIKKYGYEHPMKNSIISNKSAFKSSNTKNDNLLNKISEMNLELISYNNSNYILKCKICNTMLLNNTRQIINLMYKNNKSPCHKCFPDNHYRSTGEIEIVNYLKKFYDGEIQLNRQYLGTEVDIILSKEKLCIEFNGLYWHSELFKDKNYHIDKKKLIEDKGYDIINIWEDDWNNNIKRDIIISRLKNRLHLNKRIFARKCIIKDVSAKDSKEFLNKNHLQGNSTSSIRHGLYYEDKLVMLCTYSKARNSIGNNKGYELIRNCTLKNISVVGGFKKLLNYFIKQYNYNLYSYADADWTNLTNSSYEKVGFICKGLTSPSYYWVIKGIRINRINFQKHKLIKLGYDSNKSEKEIMYDDLKSYRIYNCGNLKFEWNSTSL